MKVKRLKKYEYGLTKQFCEMTGLFRSPNGCWMARTSTKKVIFWNRKRAVKWLERQGLTPSGGRL